MIKTHKHTILTLVLGSISLLGSWSAVSQTTSSQSSDRQTEQPRWFEIEVILYKNASESGLTNESWAKDIQMNLPEKMIDFLQPFETLDQHAGNDLPDINTDTNVNTGQTDADNMVLALSPEQLQMQQPFVKLDENLLQLKAEALNISRHVSYKLLTHFAWRQPVLGKKQASNLRIAGGFDHHETFDYSGEKKLETLEAEDEISERLDDSSVNGDIGLLLDQQTASKITPTRNSPYTIDDKTVLVDSAKIHNIEPIALPWVPEIDGSIRVYIHRNYLHVDTDLFYRRPDKEEIDIFELSSQLPILDTFQSVDDPKIITPLDNTLLTSPSIIDDNSFAWEYDGDFLSNDTEKVFTERLFNYRLKQKRRLRSNQLNYFDHPLIGMLIIIRPYELEVQEEQEQKSSNTDIQTVSRVSNP